jgi:hypothetical protein
MHMHMRYPSQRRIFTTILKFTSRVHTCSKRVRRDQDDTLKRHSPRHLASRQAAHVDGEVVQGRGPAQYANVHHAVSRAPVGVVAGDGHDVVTDACAATRTHPSTWKPSPRNHTCNPTPTGTTCSPHGHAGSARCKHAARSAQDVVGILIVGFQPHTRKRKPP